jgi:tetratricopeptide (TPR) repeat protein
MAMAFPGGEASKKFIRLRKQADRLCVPGEEMKILRSVLVLLALVPGWLNAATLPPVDAASDQLAAEASAAYDAKDWAKAATLYEELSKLPDAPPRVWLRLGVAYRSQGKYDEALAAFDKATEAGAGQFGEYGKAVVYGKLNQPEKAFESLDKAMQQGYADPEALSADANLVSLHTDARFGKAVEQAKKNQRPCAYAAENRQFDFWLGEWNVVTTQGGVPAGNSKIELILENCVVQENWQSLNTSYSGKSYNIYDQALKRWEQYWVDSAGGNIFFHGELKDGVMDYWTDEIPQSSGPNLKRHLQFIPMGPDKVRQFSQGSTDGGKTWQVEYDFTYNRKK